MTAQSENVGSTSMNESCLPIMQSLQTPVIVDLTSISDVQNVGDADDYDTLPAEMRNAKRWLVWREIHDPSYKKPRKVPCYADGRLRQGALDSPEDVANFATFEEALNVLHTGPYAGLGFALGPDGTGNHWQGIDLDDIPSQHYLEHLADDLPSYTEASPSGTGMHAIGYGRPVTTLGSNKTGIEAYSAGRFFTVTADRSGNQPIECLAAFVENRLVPLHRRKGESGSLDGEVGDVESLPSQTIKELRSALASLRADDRKVWVDIGHALKPLGEVGRGLWMEWSQTSAEYNPADTGHRWDGFKPTRTGYKAVFALAQRSGWNNPLSGSLLDPIARPGPGPHGSDHPRPGFAFVQAHDLLTQPKPIPWLIRDVFEQGALAQLFGDSGSGKSFMAIDWGCRIATGLPWQEKMVEQGPVFYIAGEGHAGISRRLKAWAQHNDESLTDVPFFVSTAPAALMDIDNAAAVAKAVEALAVAHGAPRLIIVDTLARNLGNGEENSNADIGMFINNIDVQLRTRFNAAVLIVHHTGHVEKERGRGASSLRAAMDSEYRLAIAGDIRTLTCTKAKEAEPPEPMAFKLEQVVLDDWTDADGELMTSAVLVRSDEKAKRNGRPLSTACRIALEALTLALLEAGQPPDDDTVKEFGNMRAPKRMVHLEAWRQRCYDQGISVGEQGAKQKAFNRAHKKLLDDGLISTWKDFYWLGYGVPGHQTLPGQCLDLSAP